MIQEISDDLLHPGGGTPNDLRDLADAGGRLRLRVQQCVRANLNGGERIAEIVGHDADRELAGGHGALASAAGAQALQLEADAVGEHAAEGDVVVTVEIRRLDAQHHQPQGPAAEPNRRDHPARKAELGEQRGRRPRSGSPAFLRGIQSSQKRFGSRAARQAAHAIADVVHPGGLNVGHCQRGRLFVVAREVQNAEVRCLGHYQVGHLGQGGCGLCTP